METAGDPKITRTIPQPFFTPIGEATFDGTHQQNDPATVRHVGRLASSFLAAVRNIALGESELADYNNSAGQSSNKHIWGGVDARLFAPTTGLGGFLSSVSTFIPLNCSSSFDATMVPFKQKSGYAFSGEDALVLDYLGVQNDKVLVHDALVPNCFFTASRPSGIYEFDSITSKPIQIVEHLSWNIATVDIEDDVPVKLIQNGRAMDQISLSPRDKLLARDRGENWIRGRHVEGIQGMMFGVYELEFSRSVIASGPYFRMTLHPNYNAETNLSDPNSWIELHHYLLVSSFTECPPIPSGEPNNNAVECLSFALLECERFHEDIEEHQTLLRVENTNCSLAGESRQMVDVALVGLD
jgi:hypothetical protein